MERIIVQRIKAPVKDIFQRAERYYSILSAVNDLRLTQREIQLIAFTAIRGNMSYAANREEFCQRYDTTPPTINNIISKLKKMGILMKDKGKIKVNPVILLNFDLEVTLEIRITNE